MRPVRSTSTHSLLSIPSPKSRFDALVPHRSMQPTNVDIDLRDLDYLEPDSHLSCPICHIPFIDPVSIDCGHFFCAECLTRYWKTTPRPGDRKPCPACRSTVRSSKSGPRLIINMCNDVKVTCPTKGCGKTVTRGALESHMVFYCPEQFVECPAPECNQTIKRKHFLEGQCRHNTHIECECGELVLEEALEQHKAVDCPFRAECSHCLLPLSSSDHDSHILCDLKKHCPGEEFGCEMLLDSSALEEHVKMCTMAKMTPHLKAHVANCLAPLQAELLWSQQRLKGLEEGIDKLFDAIVAKPDARIREPKMPRQDETGLNTASPANSSTNTIPLPDQPSSSSNPSSLAHLSATAESAEHRHLLALHENLRNTVDELSVNLNQLTRTVEEVDARNSMLTMNETLRLKEELTMTNNGLFSTRTQVQWLLNRERAGLQQPGISNRAMAPSVSHTQTTSNDEIASVSNGSSEGTSPGSSGAGPVPVRRTSRSSQDRVKL